MLEKNQDIKQAPVVYMITAVIYPRELGPFVGIFADEADAQAIIDKTPEPRRKLLRIQPVIVGRTAGYREWLAEMDSPYADTDGDAE
jgi:hypothetical protein